MDDIFYYVVFLEGILNPPFLQSEWPSYVTFLSVREFIISTLDISNMAHLV